MDSLKEKLGPAMKYAFWGVWAIVMLVSVAIWWMSTAALVEESKSQKTAIDGAYSTLTSLRGNASTAPNPDSHKEMEQRVGSQMVDVLEAWQQQWDYQEKILVWPVFNLGGTTDFTEAFEKFLPIETTTEFPMPSNQEVDTSLRYRYKEYIENELPGLAEVVGAKWTADFEKASGMGMGSLGGMEASGSGAEMMMPESGLESGSGMALPKESDTLVIWQTGSQSQLLDQMFPWRSKEVPSTLDILYSQEDLWVVRNLLQIIAAVNGNATKPFQATIHEILEIKLGRAVAGRAGRVTRGGAMQGGGMGMDGMGMGSGMEMGMGAGMEMGSGNAMEMGMGSGMGTGGGEAVDPAENRYVNNSYEPIAASALRSAMASSDADNAFINVAKRLPVKLALKMDQRKLPQLLTACGNARLMVEVRQVRINATGTPSGGGAANGGPGMGMDLGAAGSGFGDMMGGGEWGWPAALAVVKQTNTHTICQSKCMG
ncbi:MAG: hypothetical protein R3C05_04025 [Pirellulaceae bacterium]